MNAHALLWRPESCRAPQRKSCEARPLKCPFLRWEGFKNVPRCRTVETRQERLPHGDSLRSGAELGRECSSWFIHCFLQPSREKTCCHYMSVKEPICGQFLLVRWLSSVPCPQPTDVVCLLHCPYDYQSCLQEMHSACYNK